MNPQSAGASVTDRTAAVGEILASLRVGRVANEGHTNPPEEASFRRLFELYHRSIHGFFVQRGVAPEDARDLTQEVFVGIYTGIATFRGDAGFDTWVFAIAANGFRKWLRHRGAVKRAAIEQSLDEHWEDSTDGPLAPAVAPTAATTMLARERSERVRAAIAELPPQMRRCLVLRVEQEYKVREIAQLLNVSPETVKAHLFQARKKLADTLGADFETASADGD